MASDMGELDEIRLKPADGGYLVHVDRMRKEGKHDNPPGQRNRPKIAHNADHALEIIAKELGAKSRKGRKGAVELMAEGEPSTKHESKKKGRRKTSYKRA